MRRRPRQKRDRTTTSLAAADDDTLVLIDLVADIFAKDNYVETSLACLRWRRRDSETIQIASRSMRSGSGAADRLCIKSR